jgi:hypothetical protein
METIKHAPGPWTYHLGRGANPRLHIQTSAGYQIASTTELSKHPAAQEENDGRLANARLIAAAPELLEFIKAMLGDAERDEFALDVFCEQARAAIARTKGK